MSETQPPEGEDRVEPEVPIQADDAETPELDAALASSSPPTKPKRKLAWGWFFLGFAAPFAAYALSVLLIALTSSSGGNGLVGIGATVLNLVAAAGVVFAFVYGITKEKNHLRSFGLGGIAAYGVTFLISLLLFGACLVSLSNWGR